MSFKALSKIDKRTKFAVYGWIRNHEKQLNVRHVPAMITAICILYFRNEERFNLTRDGIELSENKKRITKVINNYAWDDNYGLIEIPSLSESIYQWNMKIIQHKTMVIYGVTSNIVQGKNIVETKNNECNYYCFCDGWKKSNCEPWSKPVVRRRLKDGDIDSINLFRSETKNY